MLGFGELALESFELLFCQILYRKWLAGRRSLGRHRKRFESAGMPAGLIDFVIGRLEAEADEDLAQRLADLPAGERLTERRRLMHKDLHKH